VVIKAREIMAGKRRSPPRSCPNISVLAKTGFIVEKSGKPYVRVCYTDSPGKKCELMRRAKDEADAANLGGSAG